MTPRELRREAKRLRDQAQAKYKEAEGIADAEARDAAEAEAAGLVDQARAKVKEAEKAEAKEQRKNDLDALDRHLKGRKPEPEDEDEDDDEDDDDPLPHRRARQPYSLLKALREMVRGGPDGVTGIEREVSQEMARRNGKPPQGLYVPWDLGVAARGAMPREFRDLTTTTGAGAVYETVSGTMIELLRNRMLTRQLGVRVMTGMEGNFSIPKHTGTGTGYWVTEGNAPTESNQTIGAVDFSPSTVGAFTDYSRKFVLQTGIDAEQFIREDLTQVIALELDRVVIEGSGAGAEPEGIVTNSSVNVHPLGATGGPMTYGDLATIESLVEIDNALVSNMAWLTTPGAKGKLRTIEAGSAGYPVWLWGADNMLLGYRAFASNQVPADLTKSTGEDLHAIIFGDWSQAILAFWSGLDVLVDPYTGGTAGNVRITVLQDVDFQLRRPESFAVVKDYDVTA